MIKEFLGETRAQITVNPKPLEAPLSCTRDLLVLVEAEP